MIKGNGGRRSSGRRGNSNVRPPGQIVLVLQGGGALGAYQVGVYRALHEAGIEPDWVIGTSIGAINAAIIAGNEPRDRLDAMHAFWDVLEWRSPFSWLPAGPGVLNPLSNLSILTQGVHGFFKPNPASWLGLTSDLGVDRAAFYDTAPLRETLRAHVDFGRVNGLAPRLTVGAVNARTGVMRYFDSREEALGVDHVMASGALPPAFPAIRIGGEPYWDGGVYSNTPIEAVLDDNPRRSSTIFAIQLWNPSGSEPDSIWQVLGRQKEIQYASRADSHIARQKQIHRLRHVISELGARLPQNKRASADVRELLAWGCRTTMHIVHLHAPRLEAEDHTKDIDFTSAGIRARCEAGYRDAHEALAEQSWNGKVDPLEGVLVHDHKSAHDVAQPAATDQTRQSGGTRGDCRQG
jgi:NTE family protein